MRAPGNAKRLPASRRAISRVIAVVLAAQSFAISRLLCTPRELESRLSVHLACPPALFPFLDYPMFRAGVRYGETLEFQRIIALDQSGEAHQVSPHAGPQTRAVEAAAEEALRDNPEDLRAWLASSRSPSGAGWTLARVERVELVLERGGFVERSRRELVRVAR